MRLRLALVTAALCSGMGCDQRKAPITEPTIVPPPATKLAFTVQPTTTASGTALNPAIQVAAQDSTGNTVKSFTAALTMSFSLNPANGQLSGTTTVSAIEGIATFSTLRIDKAATGYTLRATTPGLTTAISNGFTVTGGAASRLIFASQPSGAFHGFALGSAIQVIAQDSAGNQATGFGGAVTLTIATNPAGGTLGGTRTATAVSGVATFAGLSIDEPGIGYTLAASATGLTSATSAAFSIWPTVRVATGGSHSCSLTAQGSAYCWGQNEWGQLGDGTTTDRPTPVAVAGGHPFVVIVAGDRHTCALTSAGVAYCWGWEALGVQYVFQTLTPLPISSVLTFQSLSAGVRHTCGLGKTGIAYCWGDNFFNQLGSNPNGNSSAVPAVVEGGLTFEWLRAGGYHSCGRSVDGGLYCWGRNHAGQLGVGTTVQGTRPMLVSGNLDLHTLVPGGSHTCGTTAQGTVYCWGKNAHGQLGDGSTTNSPVPVLIPGATFESVSLGMEHTCGVTDAGAAYCWGENTYGAVGDGSGTDHHSPTAVAGGGPYRDLSSGFFHSCALRVSGGVQCWGGNAFGQTGDGSSAMRSSPVAVAGGHTFQSLTLGDFHTCGLVAGGTTYCWGRNDRGQLGDGTFRDHADPVAVSGGLAFQNISAGGSHNCGLAGGDTYCWGLNYTKELGDGTSTDRSSPVASAAGLVFLGITSGAYHSCGLTTGSQVYCWGADFNQPTGVPPQLIAPLLTFQAVAAGSGRTCALTTGATALAYCWDYYKNAAGVPGGIDYQSVGAGGAFGCGLATSGTAYCWGWEFYGGFAAVPGGHVFQALSVSGGHACGLVGGAAYCWGDNYRAQLGDGTRTMRTAPAAVLGGLAFQSIVAGITHTCALTPGGSAYCWGYNDWGQLGDGSAARFTPTTVGGGIPFAAARR